MIWPTGGEVSSSRMEPTTQEAGKMTNSVVKVSKRVHEAVGTREIISTG